MPDDAGLHDRDWYAWTQDQAARLRAWPEHLRPNGLDVELLAEEVEDLGGSQRQAMGSFIRLIVVHQLKLEFLSAAGTPTHWRAEIDNFRSSIEELFEASPSLRAHRHALYPAAWRRALREFRRQAERDYPDQARSLPVIPAEAPRYDLDGQILDEDWFPAPDAG